jgi:shikimate kinase
MATPEGTGVVLVGYRGAGKSTIGPHLAARLERPFVDLDAEIERAAGRPIPAIFAADGEPAFRDLESAALARVVASRPGCVLATGGGAVLRPANREAMRRHGLVAWLRADPATLAARLTADPAGRPSLTGRDPAAEVADVLAAREPLYAAVADLTLDTTNATPDACADRIAEAWAAAGGRAR